MIKLFGKEEKSLKTNHNKHTHDIDDGWHMHIHIGWLVIDFSQFFPCFSDLTLLWEKKILIGFSNSDEDGFNQRDKNGAC